MSEISEVSPKEMGVKTETPAERRERLNKRTEVGLSLSFCVADIMRGQVPIETVKLVLSGTNARNKTEWARVFDRCKRVYWSEDPAKGEQIARELIRTGRVRQPQLTGKPSHSIKEGHWIKAKELSEWKKQQGW